MNQNDRSKSPFSELSFSQQQEQWRIFRAQQLDFQAVESKKEPPRAQQRPAEPPTPAPGLRPLPPPRPKNRDRVRAQLSAAARHAGVFQPTSTE